MCDLNTGRISRAFSPFSLLTLVLFLSLPVTLVGPLVSFPQSFTYFQLNSLLLRFPVSLPLDPFLSLLHVIDVHSFVSVKFSLAYLRQTDRQTGSRHAANYPTHLPPFLLLLLLSWSLHQILSLSFLTVDFFSMGKKDFLF